VSERRIRAAVHDPVLGHLLLADLLNQFLLLLYQVLLFLALRLLALRLLALRLLVLLPHRVLSKAATSSTTSVQFGTTSTSILMTITVVNHVQQLG
jgi:hypothetical protein